MKLEDIRYIILGMTDGILAVLGIVIGAFVMNATTKLIIGAGLGGALALAMTNTLGSYFAETTVEYGKLVEIEESMIRDLRGTILEKEISMRVLRSSIIHGSFSFIGSMVPLLPIVLLKDYEIYISIVLSMASLAILGYISGKVSKMNLIISCIRMVGLGILVAFITSLIGYL